jgi:hypothetical protein
MDERSSEGLNWNLEVFGVYLYDSRGSGELDLQFEAKGGV